MKVIIAGATGFVGTECVRQALRDSRFTSVVALARRAVTIPSDIQSKVDPSKFKSVVIENYGTYPDDVKKELAGADGCIWTVAITPSKSKTYDWEEVRKVCNEYTISGFKTMIEGQGERPDAKPFRFMYMSGIAAERDQSKAPYFMPEYSKMRGQTEVDVLKIAAEHKGTVEAAAAKPGLILRDGNPMVSLSRSWGISIPSPVPYGSVAEISAGMLDQIVEGFEKEPLMHSDLIRIGRQSLKEKPTA